jgi:cell division protein FtsX
VKNTAFFRSVSPFSLTVVLAAGAAVSLAAALLLGQRTLWLRHAAQEADQIQLAVFLKDGAERAPVEETLRALPGLRSLRFVSKDEALEAAKADPAFSDGLSLTGGNPFPESFIVQWNPLFMRADLLDHHARRLAEVPGIDHVDYDRPRVERFSLSQKALSQLDLALETLTAAAAAILLLMAGRILFVAKTPAAGALLGGGAAALAGAAVGCAAARSLGAVVDYSSLLSGTAAAALLVLGREAMGS